MSPPLLAAWLDSYRMDLKAALERAAGDGYRRFVGNATGAEFDPRALSLSARRHIVRYARNLGGALHGLALEYPGLGLADGAYAEARAERFALTLELCGQLSVADLAVTIGGFGAEATRNTALEMLSFVAERSAGRVNVALICGTDELSGLAEILRRQNAPHLQIGVDAAAWPDRQEQITACAAQVGWVFLRDARRVGGRVEEVPFGRGDVDFAALFGTLGGGKMAQSFVVRCDAPGAGIDALRRGREYIGSVVGQVPRL